MALTFDDGPSNYTPQILQILQKYRVKATFFILGVNADKNKGILKRVAADGHSIGNHTWNHPEIINLSPEELAAEISRTTHLIKVLTGQDVQFFRPPYGSTSAEISRTILEKGLYPVFWDLDTVDWDVTITEPIYERVVKRIKDQNIILMHDGGGPRERTVEALPRVIEYLKKEGYEFLTIPEYYQRVYNI